MLIWLNGKEKQVPDALRLTGLVSFLGLEPAGVAVAVNDDVVRRSHWEQTELTDGDRVEVVRAIQGGAVDDPLVIGPRTFGSRLFLGTGKYRSMEEMAEALHRSGTEMVTVAIRYMNFESGGGDIMRHLDLQRYHLLPNTAGAYTAEQAVKMARLAREALGTNWIKLEVIGDQQSLLPDLQGTLEAARTLLREGFVVLPYTTSDLITCLRLEEMGCPAVMPLASPIGTGQGLVDWAGISRVIERVKVPVVVDAGIGCASDACRAMELGASAVLVNTAIAKAAHSPIMAAAMKHGVQAGRLGYLAGRMAVLGEASPSSPVEGVPRGPVAALRNPGEVE